MKRLVVALSFLSSASAFANTVVLNPGATLTTGSSANRHSIFAGHHNPANAFFAVAPDEQFRFAYGPTIGMGTELGDVSNFVDEVDELIDILEDPSLSEDGVQETLDHFNAVLEEIGEEGYLKLNNGLVMPLLPVYWKPNFFSGALFAELDINTQIRASILDDQLTFDDQNQSFSTATSAYLKSGIQSRLALGYSREIMYERLHDKFNGRLYGGVKVNVYHLQLSKQIMRLQYLDGRDIEDVMEDEYKNNLEDSVNVGVDAGLLWVGNNYNLGFTLLNINSPEFDYGSIGLNCGQYAEGSVQRNNCDAAFYFGDQRGEIRMQETHTKHAAATVDGAIFINDRWFLTGSLELAAYDDLVGSENQWMHLAAQYESKSYLWPAVRFGYHKNLAGAELASASVGFTFFGVLTFDLEYGLDTVTIDGTSGPRSIGFSIGLQEKF